MNGALALFCPAKLNLYLRITGRRPDGYHTLATLLHAIDLGDDLVARRTDGGDELAITAADARDLLPVTDDNLVLAAARAFAAATAQHGGPRGDRHGGWAFALHKRIPHGGGLGGGSSDAAAALRLCNALAGAPLGRPPLDRAQLHAVARTLGADVPFFLHGGTQWGFGVGDELEPATAAQQRLAAQHFTLLAPPFGCPTADVYKNHAANWNRGFDAARVRGGRDDHHNAFASGGFVNDLTAAAERVRPELTQLRRQAADLGVAAVWMTGSGSTLFVASATEGEAVRVRERLAPLQRDGVRILPARSAPASFEPSPVVWPGDGPARGAGGGA